ncbi:MAG: CRISPR-associated endoribonuclease Cas6 [Clostridiales bacterium]|nr:CRISPR-associated endoribonuclease Cas6 [Clostridiales bacterium]
MRISCRYKCNELPISYRMLFVSLIKDALKQSNEQYYKKLYEYGDKNNKQSKNFCFSTFISSYKLEGDLFKIDGYVFLNVSSPDQEFMLYLYNGLTRNKEFTYKNYQLTNGKLWLSKEKDISKEAVVCRTLSPLYIKDKNNESLEPTHENYQTELNYVSDHILKNYRGYGLKKPLKFIPLDMNKVVVKEKIKDFQEQTGKQYMYVNAYAGVFKLEGDREDLQILYQTGLGFRRNQGFGMVEKV